MLYRALIGPLLQGLRRAAQGSRQEFARGPAAGGLGLALGGGFARGFAHIGILQVLDENRIPVSSIAGTSVGSILGAAYASGLSPERIAEVCCRIHFRDFARWRISRMGLASNDRMASLIQRCFRALRFEDLKIPFAVVTTDLCTGDARVFTRGDLVGPIRASCAYPGMFEPVTVEGACLADGGLVAQVPTEAARSLGPRVVLGVSVGFNDWNGRVPTNLFQVVSRAISAAQKQRHPAWRAAADVIVEPAVEDYEWDAFDRAEDIIAAGAAAIRRALPRVKMLLERPDEASRRRNADLPLARPAALSSNSAD
jgi:NTE family protein